MKKASNVHTHIIYPSNWDNYNQREKEAKEQEFGIVSFLLKTSPEDILFLHKEELYIEFYEEPDFLIYTKDKPFYKIGLEVTKCYADERYNTPKINSDLTKICKEEVEEINNTNSDGLSAYINYVNVTFAHKIFIGERFDKKKLKAEVKAFIINGQKQGDYVRKVEAKYSAVNPKDNINVDLNSDMMYLVSRIQDVSCAQKKSEGYQDPVIRCIEKKEMKLKSYKEKCGNLISEWWLCIEVPEDAYLNPRSYELPKIFKSEYNKIVLVTKSILGFGTRLIFQSKIEELKV